MPIVSLQARHMAKEVERLHHAGFVLAANTLGASVAAPAFRGRGVGNYSALFRTPMRSSIHRASNKVVRALGCRGLECDLGLIPSARNLPSLSKPFGRRNKSGLCWAIEMQVFHRNAGFSQLRYI